MFRDATSSAILAVADLDRSRRFYRDVLALDLVEDDAMVMVFRTGATHLVVYASDFAGTNQANAVVWDAGGEIEALVDELRSRGVSFDHLPLSDGMRRENDIHIAGEMKMVWFKDPDGNVLHINQMPPQTEHSGRTDR